MTLAVKTYDRIFDPAFAGEMIRACERFGTYGVVGNGITPDIDRDKTYAGERPATGERYSARSTYFRASYAYGGEIVAEGLGPFFHHEVMVAAARELHGLPVVQPMIAYANFLLPGHDLALHTDVPEFRGAHRRQNPPWLLVAMHHSGLFESHRLKIATLTSYYQDCDGGEFVFHPEGADGPRHVLPARFNTAVLLDADSIFHGVRTVAPKQSPAPAVEPEMLLRFAGDGVWEIVDGQGVRARCRWEDLRFSITWKAYCFADEADVRRWRQGTEDLEMTFVLRTLIDDLRRRGRLDGSPEISDLPHLLTDEYVRFPPPEPA